MQPSALRRNDARAAFASHFARCTTKCSACASAWRIWKTCGNLNAAIERNKGKKLIPWAQAKKELGLDE